MKHLVAPILLLCFGLLSPLFAVGSDHIDGPVTIGHRVADLTDLYAFPTQNKQGSLTLILDTYPLVSRSGHFTDKVNYTFILRRAEILHNTAGWKFDTSDEVSINCTFKTPNVTANHQITCRSSNHLFAESTYAVVGEPKVGDDFRLYAGMRSDPFFFDSDFANKLANNGTILNSSGKNAMDGINVLSIVIEVDVEKLFPQKNASLIAVAIETTTPDTAVSGGLRHLDRVGRPEITNVTMVAHGSQPDLRDEYNLSRPFEVAAARQTSYQQRIFENIAFYDNTDHQQDWKDDAERLSLAKILADDFLVLDMSKPCTDGAFLEIEKAMVKKSLHHSCGGRRPNDDIMDTLFSLYIAGFSGRQVRDGVDHPYRPVAAQFPYLTEPDLSLSSRIKRFIGMKILKIHDSPDQR